MTHTHYDYPPLYFCKNFLIFPYRVPFGLAGIPTKEIPLRRFLVNVQMYQQQNRLKRTKIQ